MQQRRIGRDESSSSLRQLLRSSEAVELSTVMRELNDAFLNDDAKGKVDAFRTGGFLMIRTAEDMEIARDGIVLVELAGHFQVELVKTLPIHVRENPYRPLALSLKKAKDVEDAKRILAEHEAGVHYI